MRDIDILSIQDDTSAALTVGSPSISGIRLLAQRVLVILLTNMNELLRAGEGTESGAFIGIDHSSSDYLRLLITSSVDSVKRILLQETGNTPDESLKSINIGDIEISSGNADFTIVVSNKSGDTESITANTGDLL